MKRIINYILVLCTYLYSCSKHGEKNNDDAQEKVIATESKGVILPKDSISEPTHGTLGAPIVMALAEVETVPYADNIHALIEPTVHLLDPDHFKKAPVTLNGEAILSSANEKTVRCVLPEPVQLPPMQFRDDANCNIQYMDVGQGFGSSYVNFFSEDKEDNLWLGTAMGVYKFDGRSYVDMSKGNELLRHKAMRFKTDRNGDLWFANEEKGLFKYNGKFFTVYDTLGGLPVNKISLFTFDSKNDLWFVSEKGLSSFNGKQFITYGEKNGFKKLKYASIYCDSLDRIWLGTWDDGVFCISGKDIVQYTQNDGLHSNNARSIIGDKKGHIWISGEFGVTEFTGKEFKHYTKDQGLQGQAARKMICDRSGNLWFAHYRAGISCFDGKNFKWFNENEGLPVKTVTSLYEDRKGNIWAGTDGGGFIKYIARSFFHFTPKNGLKEVTMSVGEDKKGNTWIGTYDAGMCRYDKKNIYYYSRKIQDIGTITFIKCDSKGDVWFNASWKGVIKYDGKTFVRYSRTNGFPSDGITCLFEDKDNRMWVGFADAGVIVLEGSKFTHYTTKQGLNGIAVNRIGQDSKGNMWFATNNGLCKLSDGIFTQFKTEQGLLQNNIRSMEIDSSDNIWLGYIPGGLNMYNGKNMLKITSDLGLKDDNIRSIILDPKENIRKGNSAVWLSSDNGIYHVEAKPNAYVASDVMITSYDRQDGLLGLDFTTNSAFMDHTGRAWWGSVKGLTTLQTNDLFVDSTVPDVHLNYISLEQNYIDFNSLKDSIEQGKHWFIGEKKQLDLSELQFKDVQAFYNYPTDLVLPYSINNITFNYFAINWLNGHKTSYRYFLEGADEEWHPVTLDNKAIYTNIDPGTYTFKVIAKGVSGVWSKPFEYKFTILPPWWKTIWAYSVYVLAILSGIIFYFNWRTRALRKRQKELEHIIVERTADVVDEKNKVEEKNKIIEEKQKEIFDSLQYAKQIQKLLLANHKLVNETLPDSFVMFKPKDIVSGDFYWAAKKEDRFYLAVCDSTGHGVPGAFMSLLNINFLNEAVVEKGIAEPSEVFNYVRKRLIENISQEGRQDGMDGILLCVNIKTKSITYAAANNAPVIISNNTLSVANADKMPIGKGEIDQPFKLYSLQLQKGDMIMLYTDGYADQFGGPKGKKFKYKPLNDILLQNHELPVIDQENLLYSEFEKWKGDLEQVDDVCILGVRL